MLNYNDSVILDYFQDTIRKAFIYDFINSPKIILYHNIILYLQTVQMVIYILFLTWDLINEIILLFKHFIFIKISPLIIVSFH